MSRGKRVFGILFKLTWFVGYFAIRFVLGHQLPTWWFLVYLLILFEGSTLIRMIPISSFRKPPDVAG